MNLQLSAPIVNCGGANGLHVLVELLLQKFAFGMQILIPLSTVQPNFSSALQTLCMCVSSWSHLTSFVCLYVDHFF